ncbi:MAG TPA: hypothetical protein VII20_07130 [Roseiarcus sp.]|jgi:hypothetical protein
MTSKTNWHLAMSAAFFALGMWSGPAFACKGAQTLLRDDFTDEDPAWGLADHTVAQIGDGALKVQSAVNTYFNIFYQGMNFPGADACIDIVSPATPSKTVTQAGMGLWTGRGWNFIYITSDGSAGVTGLQDNNWVNPVPVRKFDGVKTGANAVNQLRLVWSAPPAQNATAAPNPYVQIFVNDKLFIKYKTVQNADRALGIYADTEGAQYQFKNLAVTE